MNQTIEGSRKWVILAGGDTVVTLEEAEIIEMPPEQARRTESVLDSIEVGDFQEVKIGNCKAEDILTKEQIAKLKEYRATRRTEKARARQEAKQR